MSATSTELFVVDRDYVVGPRRVKVRRIAEGIRALQDGVHHRWNPGNFRYRHLSLTMTEFHDLQRRLPEQGLAVDVLHHVDDIFDLPSSANFSLSPDLHAICRDAIDISRADWDAEVAERWKSIVS